MNTKLTRKQLKQESEFVFPYHYLDILLEDKRLISDLRRLSLIKIIKNILNISKQKKVLDAGCGDGRFCYELKADYDIMGVDSSEKAISFAKAFNPEVKFFVQNLENLKLPENYKFERILLIEVLEHLRPETIPKVLENLYNVLTKSGMIIITVPSKNIKLTEKHHQHFSYDSLKKVIEKFFTIEKIIYHSKKSNLFIILRKLCEISYPLSNQLYFFKKIYEKFGKYYTNKIEIANSNNCERLIAICTKK